MVAELIDVAPRKARHPAEPSAGPLFTRLLGRDPTCIGATVRGYGFHPHSINNLIKLRLPYGSSRSAAKAAMLTCAIFWNNSSASSLIN